MNSESTDLQTLALLAKEEVVIRCDHFRGLYALNKTIEGLERNISGIKPTLPVVLTTFVLLQLFAIAGPYLYNLYPDQVLGAMAFLFVAIGVILALSTISKPNVFTLNATGISLHGPSAEKLPKKSYKWKELKHIIFAENGKPSQTPNQLYFSFGADGVAEVELNTLSRSNLKDILMFIALYGEHVEIQPPEVAASLGIKDRKVINPLDFTEMWQSKLDQRFAPTVFVPLERGQVLQNGSIKILGQVAYGGMSAIYLATHSSLGTVVLKESVITGAPESDTVKKAAELFQREATLLCRINHPRVAKIYDYFVEDERHYLILEHLPGRTLRNFIINNGVVSEAMALKWAVQLTKVLQYLHHMDPPIIHRDITPDNIIVGEDGHLSVIDFGAANIFLGTATGTIVGKASYMPPEQFKGRTTTASDIYALGGVLHFITTGEDPSLDLGLSLSDVHQSIARLPVKAPTKLALLINECLKADLKERMPSADTLLHKLEALRGVKV